LAGYCKQLDFAGGKNAILQIYAKNSWPGWFKSSAASSQLSRFKQLNQKAVSAKAASHKAGSPKDASKKPHKKSSP
jgi:hypothetical protein